MLAAVLILDAVPSRAATIYFTAANDTLLELSDSTMPFWSGSLLYVPASVFGSSGLDINVSYNSAKKTLILLQSQYRLICNLSSSMTVDSNGNVYDFVALERSGTVFLPINDTCRLFGFSCVTRTVEGGNLVRIRNGSAALSDDAFLVAAAPMIASRYAEYQASHSSAAPAPDEEEPVETRTLYLALTVRSAEMMENWMDICGDTPHRVTFLLTDDFLQENSPNHADLIRRALAQGHTLGLVSDTGNRFNTLDELQEGNRILAEIACVKTRLAQVRDQAQQEVTSAGYCPLRFDRSSDASDLSTGEINQLLSGLGSAARLDLGDSLTPVSLRTFLTRCSARGFAARGLREY
jgi:hypothetical protein